MDTAALPPRRTLSREEYRRWLDAQPRGRFERIHGEVVVMAAERVEHVRAKGAVWNELQRAIAAAGVDCEALTDGVTVEIDDNDYEPDASVNCGPTVVGSAIALPNPVIVVEVLSPGTAATDMGTKLAGYFRVPSIAHYLIVDPARPAVIHHRRDGDAIATRILAAGLLRLDPPGIVVDVDAFYRRRP